MEMEETVGGMQVEIEEVADGMQAEIAASSHPPPLRQHPLSFD